MSGVYIKSIVMLATIGSLTHLVPRCQSQISHLLECLTILIYPLGYQVPLAHSLGAFSTWSGCVGGVTGTP